MTADVSLETRKADVRVGGLKAGHVSGKQVLAKPL